MKINVKCSFLMATYFALHCVVLSYVTYYLGSIGFSDLFISIVVGCAAMIGGFLQIAAGRIVDRIPKWNWKKVLLVLGSVELALALSRIFIDNSTWQWIAYGLIIILQMIMLPMVNLSSFDYSSKGMKVNFGVVRGIGSASFAVCSYIVGKLADVFGSGSILEITAVITAAYLISVLIMPNPGMSAQKEISNDKTKVSILSLIGKYKPFFVMVTGLTLMLFFHNMINTFIIRIVETVGGDSKSLGLALGLGAFAELPLLFFYSKISGFRKNSSGLLLIIACAVFLIRSVLYFFTSSEMMIYINQLLQGASFGLMVAAKSTYSDECMKPEDKAVGQSFMTLTDAVGMVAGTFIGGILLSKGGVKLMLIGGIVCAALGTVIALIAVAMDRRKKTSPRLQ